MGKLLEQRNRALDDINAGRTVKKIRDLESRVRELEEENARLKAECDDIKQVQFPRKLEAVAVGWKKQLAASQLHAEQLREALETLNKVSNIGCGLVEKALTLPSDTSALDAYVAEKVKVARDIDEKQIAYLFEERSALIRKRKLAVEAIRHCIAAMGSVTDVKKAMDWPQLHNAQMLSLQALDAIKESEGK